MDWTQIVIALLSGTTLAGIVETIRFWKQSKRLKDNQVKSSNVETQHQQIDLAEDYMKKVMELSEMNYHATLKNGTDNADIMKKIDAIVEEQRRSTEEQARLGVDMNAKFKAVNRSLTSLNKKTKLMEAYLNGPYHDWVKEQNKKE